MVEVASPYESLAVICFLLFLLGVGLWYYRQKCKEYGVESLLHGE